jgi:hypothetical protein
MSYTDYEAFNSEEYDAVIIDNSICTLYNAIYVSQKTSENLN